MSYQALARKWRPKCFQEVIGQKNIITAISNGLSLGRIHHAWLLSGVRGIGKTTIARLLAKSLNCKQGIVLNPCQKCISCQQIEQGLCLDVLEIDAASRTKIEDIKEILDNIYYTPVNSRFKIYLIDEVHMLSRYSFNALLKNIEEPPKYIKFILATTDTERIPTTIISRCLHFNLQIISQEEIIQLLKNILKKENINFDKEALKIISYYSQGSMRDALNLIEQSISLGNGNVFLKNVIETLGIPDKKQIFSLTNALLNANAKKIIFLLNKISHIGIEWDKILIEISHLLYYISMVQFYPLEQKENFTEFSYDEIRKIATHTSKFNVQLSYKMILAGRKELLLAPNLKIGVEMTLLRIVTEIKK